MGSVASPLTVTTEYWRYLHSALSGISGISITQRETNVGLDTRWRHLNKQIVILCIVDFTGLGKGITNDTLAFEWGHKTLYIEWIKNQHAGFPLSVTSFEANLFRSWLWRRKLQFLTFSFRVTLGAEMVQSALWPDYGLNYRRIVVHFPRMAQKICLFRSFQTVSGIRPASDR